MPLSRTTPAAQPALERPSRLRISSVTPSVKDGTYAAKRVAGDVVEVAAIVLVDQAMSLVVHVEHRRPDGSVDDVPLAQTIGPNYVGVITMESLGVHELTVRAHIDHVATLQSRIDRKLAAGLDAALDELELAGIAAEPSRATSDHQVRGPFRVVVDRPVAARGAWYEFFPRSVTAERLAASGKQTTPHGTLTDAIDRLPYIAEMGFDIVYLPPIHPVGVSHRKGANNHVVAGPDDVGSPWAVGAVEGGHDAVHPALGTHDDVAALVAAAKDLGLEIALDIAFQCSPDHPWVGEHRDWFHVRPDGSIAYAENPPKRYQDIVPLAFDTPAWHELWEALAETFRVWMRLGVRTFRVDNPHTKPLAFWEWVIAELKREDPGLIFLAEAFAHPALMHELSRVGFTQSYTHFPWQHAPWELRDYYLMMLDGDEAEHFRGAAWPNTPDILTDELQQGLRQVFIARLVLAATLNAAYGIYGPVFELQVAQAVREGSEEYLDSEKYQLRSWELRDPTSLAPLIGKVNRIRREHRALQHDRTLHFHLSDNERLAVYSKTAPTAGVGGDSVPTEPADAPMVVVVNTDHWNPQAGMIHLDLGKLGLAGATAIDAVDVLNDRTYRWSGGSNFISLDPWDTPAHVFELRAAADEQP